MPERKIHILTLGTYVIAADFDGEAAKEQAQNSVIGNHNAREHDWRPDGQDRETLFYRSPRSDRWNNSGYVLTTVPVQNADGA